MEPNFNSNQKAMIQSKDSELMNIKTQRIILFIHFVERFWIVLGKERRMVLKLFNGTLTEEKINNGTLMIQRILLHHLQIKID